MESPPEAPGSEPVFCPHDLLWFGDWNALQTLYPAVALPAWANMDWLARAPVVVRRERVGSRELVPVGLRGPDREQRLGAYLDRRAILRRVTPEMLAQAAAWRHRPELEHFPAIAALEQLAPLLNASGLRWGPGGGVGYALASGLPVLRESSDLDLLVRSETLLTSEQARMLEATLDSHHCRIDMQIDTGHGGFSFAEWAREGGRVLLKTGVGPFMTDDPWNRTGWLSRKDMDCRKDVYCP